MIYRKFIPEILFFSCGVIDNNLIYKLILPPVLINISSCYFYMLILAYEALFKLVKEKVPVWSSVYPDDPQRAFHFVFLLPNEMEFNQC
jgi:hypothetical protein